MPQSILDAGIALTLYLQSLGNWLITPMQFFTILGTEEFYLFIAPAVYWCLDASLGLRVGLFLMVSGCLNSALKLAFHNPRPYWYDTRVRALSTDPYFGMPSGHAQHAVVVWGGMAAYARRNWAWIAAIALSVLIGFSRIVLGAHFPSDVLAGWLFGGILLWFLLKVEKLVETWIGKHDPAVQILSVLLGSMTLILIGVLAKASLGNWSVPAIWIQNDAATNPGGAQADPLALSGLVSNSGVFVGLAAGAILLNKGGGFSAQGIGRHLALRFAIGLAGVILFWYGLGAVFPRGEYLLAYALRYVRYALVGIWVSGLAPWVFIRLKLAESKSTAVEKSLAVDFN